MTSNATFAGNASNSAEGHNLEIMRYQEQNRKASLGIARNERSKAMKVFSRGIGLAVGFLALCAAGAAGAQENLDSGKTAAQLFASDCAICHKTTAGLSKGRLLGLDSFLREHYTASRESAGAIAAYIQATDKGPAAPASARGAKRKGDKKGDEKKPDTGKPGAAQSEAKRGQSRGQTCRGQARSQACRSQACGSQAEPKRSRADGQESDKYQAGKKVQLGSRQVLRLPRPSSLPS